MGHLQGSSLIHRVISSVERVCLRDAAAVVSLTEAAVEHLKREYPRELQKQRIAVIPMCADLERFVPAPTQPSGNRVHGCIGTVLRGWFRLDWLAAWISAGAERHTDATFEIVTRTDAEQVRASLDPTGHLGNRLKISAQRSQDMSDAVRAHDLSLVCCTGGLSKLGSSPTCMGELLGCGLPVVSNAGVGDEAQIVAKYGVGVLVEGSEPERISEALDGREELLADPEPGSPCRVAAEANFSLEAGTRKYAALYKSILSSGEYN